MTDYRALCAELPQPVAEGPTDEETGELIELMKYEAGCFDSRTDIRHGMFTRAAELLELLTPQPVAVPLPQGEVKQ